MKIIKLSKKYYWPKRLVFIAYLIFRLDGKNSLFFFKNGNFGDELNRDLMQYFGIQYRRTRPLGANLCCTGSNLQEFINNNSRLISKNNIVNILGSGFISENNKDDIFMFKIKPYALRGELSKQRCEKATGTSMKNVALGDPGLLIRHMYPNIKPKVKYEIGIICHMVDKNSALLQNIDVKSNSVIFIDIEQETTTFIEQVSQCGFILSSAMHGLICADSLGIPNKHIILSNNVIGGEYKFRDCYSVFPRFKYKPVYLKDTIITNKNINDYKLEYNITSIEIEEICNNLQEAFYKFKQDNK